MSNPLPHVGQTARPEGAEQVQTPDQSQGGQPGIATESGEHPATRLPQHPQQEGDTAQQLPGQPKLGEPPQQSETEDDDGAELRHESAV